MTASNLAFRASLIFILIGIALGMYMGASQNHAPAPAHAHINLLGFVSLFMIGLFYERRDALNRSKLAFWQVVIWTVGSVILNFAITFFYFGNPQFIALAPVGEVIIAISALTLTFIVYKATASA
jgi:uncharacterized membrane-anchored protein